MKIYTRTGDDGHTNLFYGGRVKKDHPRPTAYGTVDELQAAIGVVRAHLDATDPFAELLIEMERELYVVMGELATLPENRHKLKPGLSLVTEDMPTKIEGLIDHDSMQFEPPTEFVVPGETVVAAYLDVARTVARRAERLCVEVADTDSHVLRYLNRLSDLLWVLARWREGTSRLARNDQDQEQQ
ncbi:MAG: cob(I)yrinic acid a,c-diamide adenosyltransferase [Acidimicrobiia bacterium]|nr:cob(I)yrinic acid a,c-diamide adenosyltransferase [Acidimicrobiia bacterium]